MKVQQEYDVDVLGTNHYPINWLSCIVNGPEKDRISSIFKKKMPENRKFYKQKYVLNELKCVTFRQSAYRTTHWNADLVPRPKKGWKSHNPAR